MDDDERQDMERFSMDGEFVGGEFIDGEFFYRDRRKKRRAQTKEEALYGYESSGSDSGGRRGRKKRRGGLIIEDKSSKPMNFVLGSVQNVGPEDQPKSAEDQEEEEEEEEEIVAREQDRDGDEERGDAGPSFHRGIGFQAKNKEESGRGGAGLGFQAREEDSERGGIGLGFQRGGIGFQAKNEEEEDDDRFQAGGRGGVGLGFQGRSEDAGGQAGIGLGFQGKKKGGDERKGGGPGLGFQSNGAVEEDDADLQLPSALGKRIQEKVREKTKRKPGAPVPSDKFSWQKHSSGFVGKMLQKMGLSEGRGLGKNAQGMVDAIDVKVRPKNMGMGYNNYQETATAAETARATEEAAAAAAERPRANEQLWMKKNKKKVKTYVSAEELLSRQQGRTVGKVLDMTGPQVRVVTDMKDLTADRVAVPEDDTPMPELQHNLRLLVDLVASDIQQYDTKLRHDRQTIAILEKDKVRLQRELELQSRSLEVMQSITSAVERVQTEAAARRLTLESVHKTFSRLKSEFPDEFKLWNLSAMALSHALPRVMPHFHGWQPLQQPSRGVDVLVPWMELLLDEEEAIFAEADTSPYTRLVVEAVLPHINRAVTNWQAREPEPMLRLLEIWEKVLSPSVFQTVLDARVMPKLKFEVDAWDPLQDTVPVHVWVHPWLPLLGSRMDPLCETIRLKLSKVLTAWDPSDETAYLILAPWHRVFDPASWEQLLLCSIVPKLMLALDRLEINPAQQQLDPFNWVMAWAPVIPHRLMIPMLEERFFPKWHRALCAWLGSDPDFAEVSQWYEGWKSLFPKEFEGIDSFRLQLSAALGMMEQAVEGKPVVMPVIEKWHLQQQLQQAAEKRSFKAAASAAAVVEEEMSLKQVVLAFAQENDVVLAPKKGRYGELEIYGFGSVSITMDTHNQVVMAQTGDKWIAVSLEQLLGIHRARTGGKWRS